MAQPEQRSQATPRHVTLTPNPEMKRREFLGLSVGLAATGRLLSRPAAAYEPVAPDAPYLDAHVHPRSQALITYRERFSPRRGDAPTPVDGTELIRRMDHDEIQRAFVLSTAYQMASDVNAREVSETEEQPRVSAENDFTARECARFPGRLVPFLSLNPKRGYALDEIDRCVETHRMRGMKLHLWNSMVDTGQPAALDQLRRVVAHAAQRGLPVMAHIFVGAVSEYGPDDTERFVREIIEPLPSLKICIAHLAGAGGFAPSAQGCLERLVRLCGPDSAMAHRVWVDMAAVLSPSTPQPERRRMGELLTQWGLSRTLWGSDSLPNAFTQCRLAWPLDDAAWDIIRRQRGEDFVSSGSRPT